MNEQTEINKIHNRVFEDDPDRMVFEYTDKDGNKFTSTIQANCKLHNHIGWEKYEREMKIAFLQQIGVLK